MDLQSRPVEAHLKSRDTKTGVMWSPLLKMRRNTEDSGTSSSTSDGLPSKPVSVNKTSSNRRRGPLISRRVNHKVAAASSNATMPNNVLEWMQDDCPGDIMPRILSYAGPIMMSRLNRTNRFFHNTMQQEETWKTVCEDLYKWEPGNDEPSNWKEFYRLSPTVPTDYPTIHRALQVACAKPTKRKQQQQQAFQQVRPIRIFLRPGIYNVQDTIRIQSQNHFAISLETLKLPSNAFRPSTPVVRSQSPQAPQRKSVIRRILSCRHVDIENSVESTEFYYDDSDNSFESTLSPATYSRAFLVFRGRRRNEPVFHVQNGHLILRNIDINHKSEGMDIWNGNSAVQVQPSPDVAGPRYVRPSAILEGVSITSQSGRGIVNIDGGTIVMRKCAVRDCAATGVYVGGPGSHAVVEHCDVYRNGVGSILGGVARGHSGVYLEQGTAHIQNCEISMNTLTGISAVSPTNAFLILEDSDVVGNGANQLELPAFGSLARGRAIMKQNHIASQGRVQYRSGLINASL